MKSFKVLIILLLAFTCVGCTKTDDKLAVITKSIAEITSNSAKSGGNVTASGNITVQVCGVCWSETPSPTTNDFFTTDNQGVGEYISSLRNLKAGTKYYVRAYATTNSGVMYGEEKNFTTLSEGGGNNGGGNNGGGGNSSFSVSTHGVTEITASTAQCGGVVTCNGDVNISARGVCWSTSSNPTIAQAHTTDGHGTGPFTSTMTGLSANTQYYVKAYAQSGSDIVYGAEMNFTTTEQPQSPTVTVTLIDVSPTYLELKFEPSNNTAYYCYNFGGTLTSTSHCMGVITKKITNFQGQSFQPNTEYVFSVVAYDNDGIAGEVIHPKFTTSPAPYSNYMRVYNKFYQLNYAKLRNEPNSANSNTRWKEIQLWSEPGFWVRFFTLVYWYETDNNWSSGVYTPSSTGEVGLGQYGCWVIENASTVGGCETFTITKSGNITTYDLYEANGYITAHFTGVPVEE